MCFDNTCNLKQVANLILCWFLVFSPLAFSFLFDFWSHCLAFGTVRKQFFSRVKISTASWIIQLDTLLLAAPCALPTTKLLKSSLSHIPVPIQSLPFTSPPLPKWPPSRLAPWHWAEFVVYLNFKSHSCLLAGVLQSAITWGRLSPQVKQLQIISEMGSQSINSP